MARPHKCRKVELIPGITYFKPRGIPMDMLEEVKLSVDEFESLRLADYNAFSHEESAERMNISRATFGRIVEKARYKIVDALLNGKAIIIEGGNYKPSDTFEYRCRRCHRKWQFTVERRKNANCPHCEKENIT
ncbi:MAG: hypothetical protein IGBAC_0205 [Ignavibacteriae bacterium]|nr:MAG: hypothetical protein IGBAC_0205 [Ignavibacteriota bacterium]